MPYLGLEQPNPRWHLTNLVPVWIAQVLNSFLIAYIPFICIFSCGYARPERPSQALGIAVCVVSFGILALEAAFFAYRRLRPSSSLVFQVLKVTIVGTQWLVLLLQSTSEVSAFMVAGLVVLFVGLS
jgi:hypothetical protein